MVALRSCAVSRSLSGSPKTGGSVPLAATAMKVLLVEDDADDAAFLRQSLLRHNTRPIDITRTDRISEAQRVLRAERFDVVLLDLHLPDASGGESVEKLKQANNDVPIVVLSGTGD